MGGVCVCVGRGGGGKGEGEPGMETRLELGYVI